jgi:dihydrofolate reductase
VRALVYSMGVSLDGYVLGPDGLFDWATPDPDVFAYATDEVRGVGVHLMGRRLYEAMLYWEAAEREHDLDDAERQFAELWKALPKVVLSRTLTEVEGSNTTLATGSLTEVVERLRSESAEGVIAIGGGTLASQAAALGLVDEYRLRVCPVLAGGGTAYFPHDRRRTDLELLSTRAFDNGVVALRYRVRR